MADHDLVDAIRQHQDFDALLTKGLEMGAVAGRAVALAVNKIDRLLVSRHRRNVVCERPGLASALIRSRGEPQQRRKSRMLPGLFDDTLFQHLAELIPESRVFLRPCFGETSEHVEDAARQSRPHRLDP